MELCRLHVVKGNDTIEVTTEVATLHGGIQMTFAQKILRSEHVGVKQLKNNLSEYLKDKNSVVVTNRGTPTNVILPYDEAMDLIDLVEELSDPELIQTIQEGREAIAQGAAGIDVDKAFEEYQHVE